jgi:hypothetical protein
VPFIGLCLRISGRKGRQIAKRCRLSLLSNRYRAIVYMYTSWYDAKMQSDPESCRRFMARIFRVTSGLATSLSYKMKIKLVTGTPHWRWCKRQRGHDQVSRIPSPTSVVCGFNSCTAANQVFKKTAILSSDSFSSSIAPMVNNTTPLASTRQGCWRGGPMRH